MLLCFNGNAVKNANLQCLFVKGVHTALDDPLNWSKLIFQICIELEFTCAAADHHP